MITKAVLAPRAAAGGPARELLAESLGDRTVSVAYWLPDRERFVDEHGHFVELPAPGSGRAWTAVDRDGVRVAAIIHDAALDTPRELVEAAAAASSLALENERLRADLQARVEELRVSRLRIMEAGDAARRRIERNLHDGAQQQLVALALELRVLRTRLKDPAIDDLSERLASALAELRELARGIHPAILTDRGLGPAITALADRGTVPIDVAVEVEERLPAPVEAAAYFLVAEALTNVARYAEAVERARRGAPRRRGPGRAGGRRRRRRRRSVGRRRPARARGPRRDRRRDARDRQPARRRDARAGQDPGAGVKRLHAALRAPARRLRRHDRRARAGREGLRHADRRPRGRARARRRGPDRGRHARPGVEQVLGDHPQRRRLRRAPARRARRLPVARRLQRRAHERADRPGRRDEARRPRGLDPVRGLAPAIRRAVDAGIPVVSINSGSDVFKRLGVLAHVGQVEDRAGLEAGRRLADAGVRRALCLNQEVDNTGVDARCAGLARAMREAGGRSRVLRDRRRRAPTRRTRSPRRSTAGQLDGVLGTNAVGGLAAAKGLAGTGVKIGTFDLGPDVLKAVEAGRIGFAVDQQAYLQGYMPIEMLALRARYGILPAQHDVVATGPNFVTRDNAAQALELSQRSIR